MLFSWILISNWYKNNRWFCHCAFILLSVDYCFSQNEFTFKTNNINNINKKRELLINKIKIKQTKNSIIVASLYLKHEWFIQSLISSNLIPCHLNRNVNLFYFRKARVSEYSLFFQKVYQFSLIPSHSGWNDLCQKPFLTLSLFESQNSNCYYKQDLYYWKFDIQSIEKCFKTINTSSYKKEHNRFDFVLFVKFKQNRFV